MKHTSLVTVAAAALVAGTAVGFAQKAQQPETGATHTSSQSQAPSRPHGGADDSRSTQRSSTQMERSGDAQSHSPTTAQKENRGPGTAPAELKADQGKPASTSERAQDHRGSSKSGESKSGERREQTGQAPRDDRQGQSNQRDDQSQGSHSQRTGQHRDRQNRTSSETTGSAPSGAAASVSVEQKTKIKQHVTELRVGRVENVNFSISVGAKVPRSVKLHAVPSTIIEIVPAWRRYRFVLVDEEIIIIDPESYTIVAVIQV